MESPEPLIHSVHLNARCAAPAGIMNHQTLKRDQWTSGEMLALREICAQPLGKEASRGDHRVRTANAVQHQVAQAGAHGIAYNESTRKYSNRRGDSQHHQQIGSPKVSQTAANQRSCTHQ